MNFWYKSTGKRLERRLWVTLVAGFGLMMTLMIASGWLSLVTMRRMEEGTEQISARYVGQSQLMDRLQRHEANIGVLLFSMAQESGGARMGNYRASIAAEREGTAQLIEAALSGQSQPAERRTLLAVEQSAGQLFEEMEAVVAAGRNDSTELSRRHRRFTVAIADLMDASSTDASAARTAELKKDRDLLAASRQLVVASLGLAAVCAAACVFGALLLFHRVERHAEALAKLSIHNLAEQEDAARRFSRDMHDEFGQTLNAIESSLAVVHAADPASRARIDDALALSKEAQSMAREMSQLLRPRILDDLGLDAGLRELAAGFSKRTGITVDYSSNWRRRLAPEAETHLFRIAQEALTNVSRHTLARAVQLALHASPEEFTLRITDDGGGMQNEQARTSGLGLIGMAERARAIGGQVVVNSRPGEGVDILVRVPLAGKQVNVVARSAAVDA